MQFDGGAQREVGEVSFGTVTAATDAAFHWVFRAEPHAVREALHRTMGRFAGYISCDEAGTLELTLAEVLNNIVEHAYAYLSPGSVTLTVARRHNALVCRVVDRGWPMPGMKLPDGIMRPVPADIESLAEGGWGWALIRELTQGLEYRRIGSENHVTFMVPLMEN